MCNPFILYRKKKDKDPKKERQVIMEKRLITEKQERALKLCHYDHGGLTREEAAKIMGIDQSVLSRLLRKVKKVAPQLFPIMTKQEAKISHYFMVDGWKVKEIAEYMGLSIIAVQRSLQRCRRKDLLFTTSKGRVQSLNQFLEDGGDENEIKHKF